ncbi:MAG: alpha/beta hydrolase [Gammaproteobacteria bacterium]|nr:alpha/beta hydrolase [Gammaproteobacteria bacterium]MBU1600906.1 alpha/beta hydrolase [Gammaproteobacteria bacterium]MBU2435362.1 alpha/beta hydrolase [Gammaproteobacteria bacterium]MBU2448776.1 alpha/beta hydrolase [Gammaproteobacteria bacterium]
MCCLVMSTVRADAEPRVVDIPTRPGVSQRLLVVAPPMPKAAVILFAGGHGGLQIAPDGAFGWGKGNFLVRSRQLFVDQGLLTVIIDAPSDRQSPPYLAGYRQMSEHATDVQAVIAWVRQQSGLPVWLVGTSRGTQSIAAVATRLSKADGPDGLVLTSTILTDPKAPSVPAMALDKLSIPILVAHHELDACSHCAFAEMPKLMQKLDALPRKQLLSFRDGVSRGDPCEAMAYHGFNGIEREMVVQIAAWVQGR